MPRAFTVDVPEEAKPYEQLMRGLWSNRGPAPPMGLHESWPSQALRGSYNLYNDRIDIAVPYPHEPDLPFPDDAVTALLHELTHAGLHHADPDPYSHDQEPHGSSEQEAVAYYLTAGRPLPQDIPQSRRQELREWFVTHLPTAPLFAVHDRALRLRKAMP